MTDLKKIKGNVRDSAMSPLKGKALGKFKRQLGGGWKIIKRRQLEKKFAFQDFRKALDFTNRVGEIAEKQNHHPDIYLTWGEVRLQISTHKIKGLTEDDFILAARINKVGNLRLR